MTDLRLIDEESMTFYCHGCHEHTQNLNHTCEGQVDLMVKRAEQMLNSADVIDYINTDDIIPPITLGSFKIKSIERLDEDC